MVNLTLGQVCQKGRIFFEKKKKVLHVGPLFKRYRSDRAPRVVHLSHVVCFTLVYPQSRARNSAVIFIFFSFRLPVVHGDDIIMPVITGPYMDIF